MAIELPGPKLSFMNDIFDNIEPIYCGACGKIIDLSTSYRSSIFAPGFQICRVCMLEEGAQIGALTEIEAIECAILDGVIGKREGKRRIKELKLKLEL